MKLLKIERYSSRFFQTEECKYITDFDPILGRMEKNYWEEKVIRFIYFNQAQRKVLLEMSEPLYNEVWDTISKI